VLDLYFNLTNKSNFSDVRAYYDSGLIGFFDHFGSGLTS